MQGQSDPIVHVVDDDVAVRESLEALLTISGYDVLTYDSAEAFLESARERRGCLLLDINMPGVSGLELLELLGHDGLEMSVVLLTARRDEHVRERARQLGASGFLTKPVTKEALIAAISAARDRDTENPHRKGHPL